MQTVTQRRQPQHLNPIETAERFIAGFEDDASQEGVPELLAQLRASEFLLPRLGNDRAISCRAGHGQLTIELSDSRGNDFAFIKRYECPASWSPTWWHPAHWTVHLTRICSQGLRWTSHMPGHFVVDDFGNLVEVPA